MQQLHVLRNFHKKQLQGGELKFGQVFKTVKVFKTLSFVFKTLSGFPSKEMNLDTSSESGHFVKGKAMSQLIFYAFCLYVKVL